MILFAVAVTKNVDLDGRREEGAAHETDAEKRDDCQRYGCASRSRAASRSSLNGDFVLVRMKPRKEDRGRQIGRASCRERVLYTV